MLYDPNKFKQYEAPTIEPWRQMLLDAADYMEKHGKCRFRSESGDGRVCVLGSFEHTDYSFPVENEAARKFAAHVNPSHLEFNHSIITHWNDNPLAFWRTKSWIVKTLRACANQ